MVTSPYFKHRILISFLIVLLLIVYVKAFVDNSRGQKIWIGVFDEDKVSDDESLGTYSKYASKHELVKSNSYLQFLHVCDCFDVDKLCFISLVLRLTLVPLSNKAMLNW